MKLNTTILTILLAVTGAQANAQAVKAKTEQAKLSEGRTIAYRSVGKGYPIILANRFRGNLDTWDPAFLDALAKTNRVITYDYVGTGLSKGTQADSNLKMATEIKELAEALKIKKFAVGGWSYGGMIAQMALTEFPDIISHGILIGTRLPGADVAPPQKVFFEHALKPVNDFNDETVLFFNPAYPASMKAAKESHDRIAARKSDKDIAMTEAQWNTLLKNRDYVLDTHGTYKKLQETKIPVLGILGENDISFAAEDWFKAKGKFPTVDMIYFAQTGHGPQHQYPELSAKYITEFLKR
ncbi:alpha/beta fold hydrolase [Bdellovibrio sp. HCB290]|uniref:alpha/beta fold hydrolase n=1 Tax=Bdellovibrio sp. HCB290 TaxID=3394356 RepID=UPI0039B3C9D0